MWRLWFLAMVGCATGLGVVMGLDGSRLLAAVLLVGAVVSMIGLGRVTR